MADPGVVGRDRGHGGSHAEAVDGIGVFLKTDGGELVDSLLLSKASSTVV